ncbi:MAG: S-layer homology domain-containing protein, partial [Oscillospiraceae bacterium]|nr:S-layer homology domain-containing protein [Oscillospiraceae bacterium]
MRNLKKVLALVLALVMSLSLVTIANAADFSDNAEIDYSEAVDVMVAAGIIDGVGNNSFDPNGTLTREQAAKLITYMLLGENSEKLGIESSSFKDVAVTRWSAPAIEYCASLGIIDGAGDGNFYPAGKLTGYAFAKMLLTALGYDSQIEKFVGASWTINVATLGMEVGLDDGLETVFGSAEISRQEAAQMALNAIKAPLVHYPNKGNTITVGGTVVDFTSQQYEYVTTTIARQQTISNRQLTNSSSTNPQYTIEFGEKYLPKLELKGEDDDFGRPSYTWLYDKKIIGTYLDETDLVAEFTTKVTGKDLYDTITKPVLDDGTVTVFIDGETDSGKNKNLFDEGDITRSNTDGVGATGKGVLTQVFVTRIESNSRTTYDVNVVIINTYLAIATEDYDTKNEDVNLELYAANGGGRDPEYIKDTKNEKTTATVKNDDIDVEDVKENDKFLATVADGKVQTLVAPEILSDVSIDSFRLDRDVTVDGTTYEYADTAKYDVEVLNAYSKNNLKDTTYNVVLDPYGYLIGIEQNEAVNQYVFVTGMDGGVSNLATKNADANVIFLDGKMETVTVNVGKSQGLDSDDVTEGYALINAWFTYSVSSSGVYTLKRVGTTFPDRGTKVAQSAMNVTGAAEVKIDRKNVTLNGIDTTKVYGNNDSIYINVSLNAVKAENNKWYHVVDDVDSVTTGVRNASLVVKNSTKTGDSNSNSKDNPIPPENEIYPLFKDNGYIIAAVVIGEDDGVTKSYAYVTSDDVKRESYNKADDEWTWVREAVVDGKLVDLKEVGGGEDLSDLEEMEQDAWYEIKFDADGNVKSATKLTFATNTEYVNEVQYVDDAIEDHDSVVLFDQTFTADIDEDDDAVITYRNGTLYVNTDDVKGFDVSPDVKVVLCLSDDGDAFDDVDDSYDGYAGLERAIRNLDSNFKGELSAIFDKGSAVVVIFNDLTYAEGGGGQKPGGTSGVDVNVLAVIDGVANEVAFIATGTDTLSRTEKIAAIKAAVAELESVGEKDVDVSLTTNNEYAVEVNGISMYTLTEDAGGVTKLPAAPTPAKQWDLIEADSSLGNTESPNGQTYEKVYKELVNSDFISDPTFTPVDATNIKVTGINWRSVKDKVPAYGADQDPAKSIEEFYCGVGGNLEGCTQYAIIPILKTDGESLSYKLIGKKADGTIIAYSSSWTVDGVTFDCGQQP